MDVLDMEMNTTNIQYTTKRCPECLSDLPLDTTICNHCKQKVGSVNNIGFAEIRPVLFSYITLFLSLMVFGLFAWWGFIA